MSKPVREKPYAVYIGHIGDNRPQFKPLRVPCPTRYQVNYTSKEQFDMHSTGWLSGSQVKRQTWFFRMRAGGYTLVEFTDTGARMRHVPRLGPAVIAAKLKWGG